MTARKALFHSFLKATGVVVGFALVLAFFYASDASVTWTVDRNSPQGTPQMQKALDLIEKHGCWTGAHPAPEGQIPGHAIVSTRKGMPHMASADKGFAIWLGPDGEARTGDEAKGKVYAFCP